MYRTLREKEKVQKEQSDEHESHSLRDRSVMHGRDLLRHHNVDFIIKFLLQ